jgi:hypothetical protein
MESFQIITLLRNKDKDILYKYILLVRVICEKTETDSDQ